MRDAPTHKGQDHPAGGDEGRGSGVPEGVEGRGEGPARGRGRKAEGIGRQDGIVDRGGVGPELPPFEEGGHEDVTQNQIGQGRRNEKKGQRSRASSTRGTRIAWTASRFRDSSGSSEAAMAIPKREMGSR